MIRETKDIFNKFISLFEDEYFWYQDLTNGRKTLFYSDNVKNVTGYTNEELVSMPGRGKELIVDEDRKELRSIIAEFKKEKDRNSISIDFRIERKDKKIVWLKETIKVERDDNGEITKYFGRLYDITGIKELIHSINSKNDELVKINEAKDNFIGMLSHDLRAPFTSILGFSEILLSESNLTESEKEEYLSYINDSSQNQLQLINDLLDWSRLQTGILKIEQERVHARSLVFNGVSSLTGNAIRKEIDIKTDIPDSLFIFADEKLTSQVITNLLANAIKFSPEKTTVSISANIYNEKFLEFIVKDEGVGISEEGKEKLFKIGRMFSTEGTKGEKGTGLGLALTKQIVEIHKGEIWFYSTPGKGSEFHFTLPSWANTILIVSNDEERRKLYSGILQEKYPSYQVIHAANGYEALGLTIKHMPSLIITEHDLPLMSGLQFVQTLRRSDNPVNIPVIAVLNEESNDIIASYNKFKIKTIYNDPDELKIILGEYSSKLK